MKASRIWRVLACSVLALAFGMAVYRAKTQTIAHDEALESEWFLDGSVYHVLQYNVANHILFTLIAKPIVWTFGVDELVLRAASLLGALIYLVATYLLCRRLFGEGILLFLSVAMLCMNPQILDFMPAARGYLLGLGGLAVAMYAMTRVLERGEFNPDDRGWRWGCVAASLAIAMLVLATPTNVVPAACLVLTFSAVALGGFRALLKADKRRLVEFAKYFLAPGASVGFCILWPYAIQVRPSHFYAGLHNARAMLTDVFTSSFLYRWTEDVYAPSLGAVAPSAGSWQERVTVLGIYVLLPLLFCVVTAGVLLAWGAGSAIRSKTNAQCRVFGGAAVGSVLLIFALHMTGGVHYPNARYCLFGIPLFTVAGLLASREISVRFPRVYVRAAGLLIAAMVVMDYGMSVQVKQFRYNAYDVISLKLYQTIAEDAQRRGLTSVRVGGTWWYEPEINFYRRKFKAKWMKEYAVKDKSYVWQSPDALEPSEYDYFVFTPEGDPGLTGPHVRTILQDGVRGITVVANEK
jgi:hypothetical protein